MKTVRATYAKNQFGEVLKMAESEPVYIAKRGVAKAVVVDAAQYDALVKKARDPEDTRLDELRARYDALFASMQTEQSRRAMDKLLTASADELNRLAARAIRKKRRSGVSD